MKSTFSKQSLLKVAYLLVVEISIVLLQLLLADCFLISHAAAKLSFKANTV